MDISRLALPMVTTIGAGAFAGTMAAATMALHRENPSSGGAVAPSMMAVAGGAAGLLGVAVAAEGAGPPAVRIATGVVSGALLIASGYGAYKGAEALMSRS